MPSIKDANNVLEKNILKISKVSQWSELSGFKSVKYFSRKYQNYFGLRPKRIIIEKIKNYLFDHDEEIFYSIALDLGFQDDQALYKFLKRHTGKTLQR